MNAYAIFLAVVAGAFAGGLYFGSLWWVVQRIPRLGRPGYWLLASFVIRSAALMAFLSVAMSGRWERLMALLLGLLLARTIWIWSLRDSRSVAGDWRNLHGHQ